MEKNQPDDTPLDEISREILRYVVAHPRAKDTVSGITKWWLARSVSQEGTKRVEASLQILVNRGWLIGRSPQSETIYSLNEDTLPEIERFLGQSH
jgi:hypothetical protein